MSDYTVERNAIQKQFLNDAKVERFIHMVYGSKRSFATTPEVEFEEETGWDLKIKSIAFQKQCECSLSKKSKGHCSCKYKDDTEQYMRDIFIKIVPTVGNDCPALLRVMADKVQATTAMLEDKRKKRIQELVNDKLTAYYQDNQIELFELLHEDYNKHNSHYYGKYVLLVDNLRTDTFTKKELKQICTHFRQRLFELVFLDDLNTTETKEEKYMRLLKRQEDLEIELEIVKKELEKTED